MAKVQLRVLEIFNQTLDMEVRERLAILAGHKARQEPSVHRIREDEGYYVYAPLSHDDGLRCYVGYAIGIPGEFPTALVSLDVLPEAEGREATVAAMKQLAQNSEYDSYDLDVPDAWAGVIREAGLPALLSGDDDLTQVKRFFLDGIAKLEEDLKALKKEHPGLSWEGRT